MPTPADAQTETQKSKIKNEDEPGTRFASAHELATTHDRMSVEANGDKMDVEDLSDNDGVNAVNTSPEESTKDIVEFSIGQEQLRMKSPKTPVDEKAKALDQFKDYVDVELEDKDVGDGDASLQASYEIVQHSSALHNAVGGEKPQTLQHQPSPCEASRERATRSNASKSVLKEGLEPRMRRASSDSTGMVGTLKKFLPDMQSIYFSKGPSLPTFGFGLKSKGDNHANRPKRSSTLFSTSNLHWISSTQTTERAVPTTGTRRSPVREREPRFGSSLADNKNFESRSTGLNARYDRQEPSVVSPGDPRTQPSLKRATSERSLFIRYDLEQITTLEDAEKWAKVSEQINSRFKAITDSFQDSAISRMPKIPNVSLSSMGSFMPSLPRSNSITTRVNKDQIDVAAQRDAKVKETATQKFAASDPATQARHPHPCLSKAVSDLTGDVVVLGGYRGSILRSAQPPHKQLWVPVKVRNAT